MSSQLDDINLECSRPELLPVRRIGAGHVTSRNIRGTHEQGMVVNSGCCRRGWAGAKVLTTRDQAICSVVCRMASLIVQQV